MSNNARAFTIVELLIVIAVIIVLAGLVLGTSGYVQKKGGRSRAEAEIAAMSAALESYKADNGIYPRGDGDPASNTEPFDTDELSPSDGNPANYANASKVLYRALSGDTDADREVEASEGKSYFNFKPNQLLPPPPSTSAVRAVRDPFGNCYGYSTMKAANPAAAAGYNPTFDLWSTAGGRTGSAAEQAQWIKNW